MTKKRREERWWLMDWLLTIMRTLGKREQAEFPMELNLTCAEGYLGRISFCLVGGTVHVEKGFEAAPDVSLDAEVFPLLVSCIDARGRKFNVVMEEK